ncbi:MAG TPA: hypothetical protein VL614_28930 [Acetobacteraceae bacterium]|jgi:hypothetical protein|nr:hypothetical protein [Acetobacteraceae bacterium]
MTKNEHDRHSGEHDTHKGGDPHEPSIARFTWNPEAAGLSGRPFTADTIKFVGNLTDVPQPDGTHIADRIEVVTGFSLNGHPVTPAGFGTNYGLYFEFVDHNTSDFPPKFLSVDVTLKADPGNLDGPVVSDTSQTGFTNTGPTGQADDIVLAHGSMVNGMLFLDDSTVPPTLNGIGEETFVPDIAKFFKGGSDLIKDVASNPVTLLTMTDVPGVGSVTNFNNYAGQIQFVTDHFGHSCGDSGHHA